MTDINKLLEIMAKLRDAETGCPWDIEQTFSSIAPYTIEEAYEVADAIAEADFEGLCGELGDLLLQVVFHSQMAAEQQRFDFADVVDSICQKMLRRHPHVFGTAEQIAAGPTAGSWEAIKAEERRDEGDESALAGVTKSLPALKLAQKMGERAAADGFDWPDISGVRDKIVEELDELGEAVGLREQGKIEEELGDLLFSVVNMARHLEVDAEAALHAGSRKFEQRFRAMEAMLAKSNERLNELDVEGMDVAWRRAKQQLNDQS